MPDITVIPDSRSNQPEGSSPTAGDQVKRVFYFGNSPVRRFVEMLPAPYQRVPLSPANLNDPGFMAAGVLLVEASDSELALAASCKILNRPLEIVALTDSEDRLTAPSNDLYACLPKSISIGILVKILENAFTQIRLLAEKAQTQSNLVKLADELRELNAIGVSLSAERDMEKLLDLILRKAREITHSDGGSLYLVEEDQDGTGRLRFKLTQNDSILIPFKEFTLPLSHGSLAGHVAVTGETRSIEDAYTLPDDCPFQFNRSFDRQVGYRTKSMLAVPLKTPQGEIIGVFQLINCKPDFNRRFLSPAEIEREVIPFSHHHQELAESLASQAAVAVANSRLYESIQTLFEGFVRASVTAIEARDPSTAGHSFRVADLTVALAELVDREETGPYAHVHFSPQEIKEIRYASILHDFGKVGVREHVLVKAKKLYPFHLDLIMHRMELIKQGIELRSSQRKLDYLRSNGPERFDEFAAAQDDEVKGLFDEIDRYLRAIMIANEPTVVQEDSSAILTQVALRCFEDHQGSSRTILTPEEARFLSIPRGSLTDEERMQIESHVTHTYRFLAQIPWTKDLRSIPAIAGAHHERLNGRGYPSGISAQAIPIQTRLMMIADVFDALTASDRPYKKALSLDRALDVLEYEKHTGGLDGDLVDLFVRGRVYERVLKTQ